MATDREQIVSSIEQLFKQLIEQQRRRVLSMAQRLDPQLTEDDIAQPHDFPKLAESAEWNYEDGLLAGYLSAQMALRVQLRQP